MPDDRSSARPLRPLGVVLVDDEPPARALLREYLSQDPAVTLLAECANGYEAVKAVHDLAPDVLILDIQMPKLNGFEVLELLEESPEVIFSTAHDQHALKAFEIHAADYLLKPFDAQRLHQALDKTRQRLDTGAPRDLGQLSAYEQERRQPLQRILVRDGAQIHVISVDEIAYLESQDDYVKIHTQKTALRKKQTLSSLQAVMDAQRFVRIHRCYLLNLDHLERIEPYSKDGKVAFLTGGARLPVSRAGYARLKEHL